MVFWGAVGTYFIKIHASFLGSEKSQVEIPSFRFQLSVPYLVLLEEDCVARVEVGFP